MRVFSITLRIAALGLWAFWYMYVSSLACAFGNPNGTCYAKMPWQLQGEDLMLLVIVPGLIVLAVFAVTWLILQSSTSGKDDFDKGE